MQEFLDQLRRLKDGCQAVFEEIRQKCELLPEEVAPIVGDEEIVLEPPLGDYSNEKALRITPGGLFWERRRGRLSNTVYAFDSGDASPDLASTILQSWLEYWRGIARNLAEAESRISLRNRQIRDLRRQLRK